VTGGVSKARARLPRDLLLRETNPHLADGGRQRAIVLEALDASVSVAPLGSQELLFANKLYRQWFDGTTAGHLKLVERAGTPETQASEESLDTVDSLAGLPVDSLANAPLAEHAEVYIERLNKWLEVRSRYLNWVDGRLAQMVIATDITARLRAEEQAAQFIKRHVTKPVVAFIAKTRFVFRSRTRTEFDAESYARPRACEGLNEAIEPTKLVVPETVSYRPTLPASSPT